MLLTSPGVSDCVRWHACVLTGIDKVSAGDVVGAEMAEDIRQLVPECFASIGGDGGDCSCQ